MAGRCDERADGCVRAVGVADEGVSAGELSMGMGMRLGGPMVMGDAETEVDGETVDVEAEAEGGVHDGAPAAAELKFWRRRLLR